MTQLTSCVSEQGFFRSSARAWILAGLCLGTQFWLSAQTQPASVDRGLTLDEVVRRVVTHNESLQIRMLEAEISRKTFEAERGIFEPQVVGSVERIDSERPNNTQQLLSLGFSSTPVLIERNTLANGGLEFLLPTGARFRNGYTLRRLDNNLQRTGDKEYETFLGTSVVQPLLKNAGPTATKARIRLAALATDVAFQEYRRQLMLVIAQSESAYWDLYLTQEQRRISEESVGLATKILGDNRARREVGKAPELEVLQAEAGVALRQTRQKEAELKVYEGANRLNAFFSDTIPDTNMTVRVLDQPGMKEMALSHFENYKMAFDLNPDYLARLKQTEQEKLRVAYAKNQRLPQVDLRGSYGLNGLGASPAESWDNVERAEFPAWSVGLELRIPLTGGIKERKELEAAQLGKKKSLLALKEAEVQIANSLDSAIRRVQTHRENVQSYQSVVDFHQKLLETQLARLEVGSIDSRAVLETEEKLFEAKVAVIESQTFYRKALLELELVRGTILRDRRLDLTKNDLQARTAARLRERNWSDTRLEEMQKVSLRALNPDEAAREQALRALREKMHELNPRVPSETTEQTEAIQERALEVLRQKVNETKPAPNGPTK